MARALPHLQRHSRNQVVANAGLFYVCYKLSCRGWNVMPTSRNARGVDVVIYNQIGRKKHTVQVKALSKRNPVPLGPHRRNLIADYVVVCRGVRSNGPECFVLTSAEVRRRAESDQDEKSWWLQPNRYESDLFKERWERIGKQ